MGDRWETSVKSCGPRHPEWETSVGDKWETSGRQVWETSVGDKWDTSVNSCGPRNPEWETSAGDKCGSQVWETSVGDKCKPMRPKTSRVGARVGDRWETSVNSCAPRHPEWETRGRQV